MTEFCVALINLSHVIEMLFMMSVVVTKHALVINVMIILLGRK